jgi:predicted MFS family arabinose efflux permease
VSAAGAYSSLIVLLGAAGVGYGMLNPTSTKAVMAWSPPAQRATAVGLKQVGLPFGGALGAALLPLLAVVIGWRLAILAAAALIAVSAVATALVYRDPPDLPASTRAAGKGALRVVLRTRALWLVAGATLLFAGMQTVFMAFFALYLQERVGLSLLAAGRYLALAQASGMAGRIAFGVLSDRVFDGGRRAALGIAGCISALCACGLAFTGPGASAAWLTALAVAFGFAGIGWNGVQHTLMAELAGPGSAATAVGLGLAVASLGVTLGPPLFGWCVELAGSYRGPWIGLAGLMLAGLSLLGLVRERPRLG